MNFFWILWIFMLDVCSTQVNVINDSFKKEIHTEIVYFLDEYYVPKTICLSECLKKSICTHVNYEKSLCSLYSKYNFGEQVSPTYKYIYSKYSSTNQQMIQSEFNYTSFTIPPGPYNESLPFTLSTINNPFGINAGVWGSYDFCDENDYVIGFKTKYDDYKDITALNAVELKCKNGKNLRSKEGVWGTWGGRFQYCSDSVSGFLFGMQAKTETGDNSATNVIRLICTDGKVISSLEGLWSTSIISVMCPYGVIVGFRTQVEPNQGLSIDDTSLNNIEFVCKII